MSASRRVLKSNENRLGILPAGPHRRQSHASSTSVARVYRELNEESA
jgi:hypothetical protein